VFIVTLLVTVPYGSCRRGYSLPATAEDCGDSHH
jgi:hypothetical protein